MFIIFLVFCVVVGWVRVSYLLSFSVLWYEGERFSYLLSFLCCGRMGSVFFIFLVFCVVVGRGAFFLSS